MGKQWTDFIFLRSKITADGDWRLEIKRRLLLQRKAMTNLDSILKSRDISLPKKVHLVKAMVFLVVIYGCESWTIKKDEHKRIDAFEVWCWRRLLRVPWTARKHWLLDTSLDEVYWPCSHSRAIHSFHSQLEWKIGLAWANTRGILNSPS